MRQGECLGIERGAIDLERDLVTIRWQAQKLKQVATPDESISQRDLGCGYWLRRPPVRLHDARHGVATLLLEAGVDIHVIQTILGHSSVFNTKGYAHVNARLAR